MNKLLFLIVLILAFKLSEAQISAVTETGRRVILFNDGTWKYNGIDSTGAVNTADTLKLNRGRFVKSKDEIFLVTSTRLNVGVFIDPDGWTYSVRRDNETNPEFRFTAKSTNSYGIMMTEKTVISL